MTEPVDRSGMDAIVVHFVPHILDAIEAAKKGYAVDPRYNGRASFGYALYLNMKNRLVEVSEDPDVPISCQVKNGCATYQIDGLRFKAHGTPDTLIPRGAKRLKMEAQANLYPENFLFRQEDVTSTKGLPGWFIAVVTDVRHDAVRICLARLEHETGNRFSVAEAHLLWERGNEGDGEGVVGPVPESPVSPAVKLSSRIKSGSK